MFLTIEAMPHPVVLKQAVCPAQLFSGKVMKGKPAAYSGKKNTLLPPKPAMPVVIDAGSKKVYGKPAKVLTLFDFI